MKREYSIKDYLNMLMNHIRLVIILPFVFAIISYCYTVFLVTPVYSTSMLLYVKNTDAAQNINIISREIDSETLVTDEDSSASTSSDSLPKINDYNMGTSARIASTCSLLFKTTRFMQVVLNDPQIELNRMYGASNLKNAVNFASVNGTQILKVSVDSMDPRDTVQICQAISRQAEGYYKNFFPTGQIFMVEEASIPYAPTSPNLGTNIIYGFGIGLAIAVGISLLTGFIDTTIKPNDDLYKIYNIPVFAEILDVT